MAKEYKVGERYYLPVLVSDVVDTFIKLAYLDGGNNGYLTIRDKPDLLFTAEEIDHIVDMLNCGNQKHDEIAELKARNAELEALLKEVMATRDEAIKQNNELIAENKKLKAWYEEANKTASEAAEANDDLKAKIADLRNRVGEQLAQIQDLNAEVHFHKEFCEGVAKQQEELQARYDELDSVNKEQAEKIRRQDKALTDLKKRNDDLQAENTNLTFLLEDAPEKETTKTLHVVLNDGTEIEFRRYTAYDYRTDINMFVVKDGERYIAGFLRGDKPMNLAYWWTE